MLKLLAEVDEFILEQSKFFCESCENAMIYSYRWSNTGIIKIVIHILQNNNLWIIIHKNDTMHVVEDEFRNFDQFKKFFCKEFKKYLL